MSTPTSRPGAAPAEFETRPAGGAAGGRHRSRRSVRARCAASQHFLHAYPTTIPFLVLVLGVVFFSSIVGGKFFAPFNLSLILQQVTIIATLGIAQTLVILTAGIDLSVGVIMILCSVVMGRTCVVYGVPLAIAFPLGLARRPRLRRGQRR